MSYEGQPQANTNRELFREVTAEAPSAYYENSLFVTADGRIGMNVGGTVHCLPIADWHRLAEVANPSWSISAERDGRLTPARRFALDREVDVSGVSGTGRVADGVLWPDGTASVRWRGDHRSVVFWDRGWESVEAIHGHGGATAITWLDGTA